ncbi:MAG: YcaO-like family protein [Deltaproteobacteria bacterium]|nr:YcaO-like family protein [Deltaproteobacteria bacterium]
MEKKPIRLADCFKHYTLDQDKVCTPTETIKRFKERLQEVQLDVLKEVRRIDNGRLDIPVYFSVCGKDALATIGTKKQMGKGSTPEQSQASACMELGERFSFFSFMKNPDNFIHDTYANLKKSNYPLLPLQTMLQSVHDTTTGVATLEKLIDNVPIQWTWATNLNRQEEVLVPFSWFYAINEFNGPSAGNSLEEAISQGVCEVVERHVSAVVSHDRHPVPAIDTLSIMDPIARELLAKFTRNGIEVHLNDFTLDTGIPTVGALAIDRSTFPESSEIVYTAGTTPNAEKAVIRALTEVAQLAGDFNSKANYVASGLPKPLSMDEVPYLTHSGRSVTIEEMPDLSDDNIKVELENCLAALARINLEVYIINVTHPRLNIPAIYTIIPGAHFRERSRINNVGLFAAKLVAEKIADPRTCRESLLAMQEVLPQAYYLEFYLGRNLMETGQIEEALHHLHRALTLRPEEEDIPYIYSYIGDGLKSIGRFDEAIAAIRQGLDHDEERPDMHNILGVCYFKLGQHDKAISHFHRAVELAPTSAIDYANLGVNYRKIGKTGEAAKYLELALSMDPSIEFAREQLAACQG